MGEPLAMDAAQRRTALVDYLTTESVEGWLATSSVQRIHSSSTMNIAQLP